MGGFLWSHTAKTIKTFIALAMKVLREPTGPGSYGAY